MSDVVTLDSVSVELGAVSVVEDLSLSAEEGEFLGLVGPNGAGKTTLLRTINGVLTPESGTVTVSGQSVLGLGARERSRLVATVPQDTNVRFDLSVTDLVAMGRTPYRNRLDFGGSEADRDHVERALERTELTGLRDRSVGAISGGERQRAYIARALAQDTPLLLCDEPTASLDVNHQVAVLELLSDLVEAGRTVVAAIHDLDLAARFCDRLALLSNGSIQAVGTPETVLTGGDLDAAFDTRTTVATNPVTGTPTVTAHGEPGEYEGRVHVVGGGQVGARVTSSLVEAGYTVTAGPLREGDLALSATRSLGVETTTLPPTGTPEEQSLGQARKQAAAAETVVLADVVLGETGWPLSVATEGDALVFVEERPLHERNYGGKSVRERYERVQRTAETTTADGVVAAVSRATPRREATADD